jgi:hypothetical protein
MIQRLLALHGTPYRRMEQRCECEKVIPVMPIANLLGTLTLIGVDPDGAVLQMSFEKNQPHPNTPDLREAKALLDELA